MTSLGTNFLAGIGQQYRDVESVAVKPTGTIEKEKIHILYI